MKESNCTSCGGTGYKELICGRCDGSGEGAHEGMMCGVCSGLGTVDEVCAVCGGTGEDMGVR